MTIVEERVESRSTVEPGREEQKPQSPARAIRLWPAYIVLAVQLACLLLQITPSISSAVRFGFMMLGPMTSLGLFTFWLFFASRLRWSESSSLWGLMAVTGIVSAQFAAFQSGISFWIYGIPAAMTVTTIVLTLFRDATSARRLGMAAVGLVAGWNAFNLLVLEGFDGAYHPQFRWRWAADREPVAMTPDPDAADGSWSPQAVEWKGFRGNDHNSRTDVGVPLLNWDSNPPRELWRIPVGPGWSSMSYVAGRLFTQEQRGESEFVTCYDAASGKLIWQHGEDNRFSDVVSGAGPRSTPTYSDGKIYALGAKAVLVALDASSGKQLWRRDLMKDVNAQLPVWGFSGSPTVTGNLVVVYAGGSGDNGLMAFDASTGETVWTFASRGMNFSSAQPMQFDGEDQLVFVDSQAAHGLQVATGKALWSYPLTKGRGTPIVQSQQISNDSLLVPLGDGVGVARIKLQRDEKGAWQAKEEWVSRRFKPSFNDFVFFNGYVYGFDNNLFGCLDASTGKLQWKVRGYDFGQVVLLADVAKLCILTEKGELALVETNPEQVTAAGKIPLLNGKTWNHPIVVGNRVFARNGTEMVCVEMQ